MKTSDTGLQFNYQELPGYHIVTDKNASIVDISKDAIRLLRKEGLLPISAKIKDVLGKNILEILNVQEDQKKSLEHHFAKTIRKTRRNPGFRSNKTETISFQKDDTCDKNDHIFSLQSRTTINDNNEILCYTTAYDVTELEQKTRDLEQKTEEAELLKKKAEESERLKTTFLANMSHEVRTPMNAILGFSELIKKNPHSPKAPHHAKLVYDKGRELLALLDDLLNYSKLEAGQIELSTEVVNVQELFEDLSRIFSAISQQKRISLTTHIAAPIKDITIDRLRVNQILSNLTSNALKFTPEGGKIDIILSTEGNNLVFSVSDTGIGIPKDKQSFIFERFRQANADTTRVYGGTGLGLPIAKELAKLMGGDITVESTEGMGSTFSLSIPFDTTGTTSFEHSIDTITESNNTFKNKTVLVVEDDQVNADYITILIEDHQGTVMRAENATETFDLLNKHSFDIIFMDVRLPHEDGYSIVRKIKSTLPHVTAPIIMQTAYADKGDQKKAYEVGASAYISKPIDSDLLYAISKQHLA